MLLTEVLQFSDERDWERFRTPKNLATALGIEVEELQELMIAIVIRAASSNSRIDSRDGVMPPIYDRAVVRLPVFTFKTVPDLAQCKRDGGWSSQAMDPSVHEVMRRDRHVGIAALARHNSPMAHRGIFLQVCIVQDLTPIPPKVIAWISKIVFLRSRT